MAEVGNLTVKVGIDGASKAVQDLEKIRRQLELINTLARNVAASFATVNTQLRTFDSITKSMDNANRSGERYNYTLRNTARIVNDIGKGQGGRGFGDFLQTLAASKTLSGFSFQRAGMTTTPFGQATTVPGSFFRQYLSHMIGRANAPFSSFASSNPEFLKTILGRLAFKQYTIPMTGFNPHTGPYEYNKTSTLFRPLDYLSRATSGGLGTFLKTPMFGTGFSNGFGSAGGMLGIAGAAGIFTTTIGVLVKYMQILSTAVLQGAQAMSGFVRQSVETAAQFQSIKSANISGILGAKYGGVYNPSNLKEATKESNAQFAYMRNIAEKSVYTLPEIAGAANILTQNNIPLNRFLETTALTAQATQLKGGTVQEVARIFARLAYGDFPDREIGAKYGLIATSPDLRKLGFKFDKQNSMLSKPADAVNMTQDFLLKRFGSGFKVSAKNFDTKFATLMDKLTAAFEKVGSKVIVALIPAMEQLGKTVDFLSKSGIFDMLGQSIATFISQTMDLMKGDEFKRNLSFILAAINEIPNQLYIMASGLMKVVSVIRRTTAGDVGEIIGGPTAWVAGWTQRKVSEIFTGKSRNNPLFELYDVVGDFASGQISAVENIMNMTDMMYGMMNRGPIKPQKETKPLGEEKFKSDLPGKAAEEGNKKLQQLVDNSKKLIDLFDLRKQTIGLGPLSQIGVTGVELAAAGMPMISSHKIDPSNYSSISAGPVRGINQLEKGINALNRENANKAKAGRGIRTSR